MITILDYGVGNLGSVEKAFQYLGYKAEVTSDIDKIESADGVVLPGVGAFADAMNSLETAGLSEIVKKAAVSGKPFLGICLGLQLLFDYSEEGGELVKGLGILRGAVKQLPRDAGLKVPHMGWNSLDTRDCSNLFIGLQEHPYVYFVHSYYLEAEDRDIVAATTRYGVKIDAAVVSGSITAVQFHPEKSGETGLGILKNWASEINTVKSKE